MSVGGVGRKTIWPPRLVVHLYSFLAICLTCVPHLHLCRGFYLLLELVEDILLVGQLCQEVGPAWECLSADDKGS